MVVVAGLATLILINKHYGAAARRGDSGNEGNSSMSYRSVQASLLQRILFAAVFVFAISEAAFAQGAAVPAQAAAVPTDVADGQRIWATKAGCPFCHGWAADGQGDAHSEGNAPSLRATQLTVDQIHEVIQCGRPGTAMPHFDKFAYTDKRCYGSTAADLGNQVPNDPPTALQPFEIQAVADYVAFKLKGLGPVTQEQCVAYFGGPSDTCNSLPKAQGALSVPSNEKAASTAPATAAKPNG
jgi:hypothetical protein